MPGTEQPDAVAAVDSKAFEILVRQHHRRLLAYALALVSAEPAAEDIVQDAFLAAYERLAQFDPSRDFGAWMRGIVRNKYREWARGRREIVVDDAALEQIEQQHQRWDCAEEAPGDALRALRNCLTKLPPAMCRVVDLFYMQRLPGAEVASRLAESPATVRKRLQRARQKLASCIGKALRSTA